MTDEYPQKITFGEMRASGVTDVLVYCRDYRCSHYIRISAEFWPDHLRLSDVEDCFVCRGCGKPGADIRPEKGRPDSRCTRGRMLTAKDFIRKHPFNSLPGTERLLARRERR